MPVFLILLYILSHMCHNQTIQEVRPKSNPPGNSATEMKYM